MKAIDTTISLIRNRVNFINLYSGSEDYKLETRERLRNELMGMMICLKNIASTNEFYNIIYNDDGRIEFGYYDKDGKWCSIVK